MTFYRYAAKFRAFSFLLLLAALAVAVVGACQASEASGQTKPGSFALPTVTTEPLPAGTEVQTVLAGMVQPVAMAFDSAGRLFYTERSGAVRLFANGALQASPVITFPNIYNGAQCIESRLLGIAVDPQFSANRHVYVYYTEPLECNVAVNRVVRFSENGGVGANPTDIFTSTQTGPLHNGGILDFGPDGKLYITLGDNNNAATAQDVTVKAGKMHRINPDGTIPPGNPTFTQTGALPSIYAIGMRNPFGFAFDTVVSGRIFMSDNGPECDDELNRVEAGYNYGWRANYPCDDGNPDPTYNSVAPLWYVPQGENPAAPTGVEVYNGSAIPAWQDHLFMCSFADRKLRHFYLNADRTQATTVATVQGVQCGMDLATGPDGALYYIDAGGYTNGNLKRIAPTPPQAPCGTMVGSIVPSPNLTTATLPSVLNGVASVSANDAWAVGTAGTRTLIERWNGSQWSVTHLGSTGVLNDVVAVSSNNVWAVGGTGSNALIMHWDGTQWTVAHNFTPGMLEGVDAVSSNDIWAVGTIPDRSYGLIMHWNGTQWRTISSPGGGDNQAISLYGVTAIASNDVWAVGAVSFESPPTGTEGGFTHTLAMHWNGSQWDVIPTPSASNFTQLNAVHAISSNDIWAVGGYNAGCSGEPMKLPVTMHWNGTQWSMRGEHSQCGDTELEDVDAASTNDVWAAGQAFDLPNGSYSGRSVHWDGSQWSGYWVTGTALNNYVTGVDVRTTNDVWAVGWSAEYGSPPSSARAFIARWSVNGWSVVPSPIVIAPTDNTLRGASALAPDDVWAVGWHGKGTLTQHWNGTQWTNIPSATNNPSSFLHGVTAIAPNDVWAAGYFGTGGEIRTLIEHWNGAQWSQVPSPNVGTGTNQLRAIDASSPQNVWAVGHYTNTNTVQPLTLRWQGTQWDVVPVPDLGDGTEGRLLSVAVIADDDAWAVGNFKPSPSGNAQTLVLHWNGSAWSRVPSSNADAATNNFLRGVTAVAPDDVWATGYYGPSGTGQSLFLHWNGSAWSRVLSPNTGDSTFPIAIEAVSANDVWAVGNAFSGGIARSLVMHWDGGAWSVVPSPNASSDGNYLFGIAPASSSDIWMVGDYSDDDERMTLIERYQPQLFTDVTANNTFYPYVQCLACRGIMGGYNDGTFRPNNNVTRGQLSKIVANSAGFNEPVVGQTFEDVAPDSTFYVYIERMAARGIIGGYPCGGAGEPCGAGSKPYFRPNANATRGQISKIVSQAKGFTDPVSGQTFEDVPPSNGFYLYIERLASRGIMGGYPCGTVSGEPCSPQNRPYFRWGNNATRGQSSKIVANTFFPNCETAN